MHLLEIRDLHVSAAMDQGSAHILRGIALTVGIGEHVGIVGESGCGKSMTALAAMGLLPNDLHATGSISCDGVDIIRADERSLCAYRGSKAAMIFQEPMTALNPVLPIGRQILEAARLHLDLAEPRLQQRLRSAMTLVGLPPDQFSQHLYPHQLSGGQRQRVMIAIALICGPKLLIADEPTTALDVTVQAQILRMIAGITRQTGMALLLITHDLGVVAGMTERLYVMYAGQIVEQGKTAEIFARKAHPYTRALFQARPQIIGEQRMTKQRLAAIPGSVPNPNRPTIGCAFAERCPRMKERCRHEPPLLETTHPDHQIACHYPVDERR